MKLAVGTVMLDNVHPNVMSAFGAMMFRTGKEMPELEVVLLTPQRMEISTARNVAIEIAIQKECDLFFWLDDDTMCQSDTLVRLIKRLEEHPEISAISPRYYVRGFPFYPMAFHSKECSESQWELKKDEIDTTGDGLMECRALGNGCTMTRMSVFKSLVQSCEAREWYRTGKGFTEDVYFAYKAVSVDPTFKCAVDLTLTAKHMLGTAWLDGDNVEYMRLRYKLAQVMVQDSSVLKKVHELLDAYSVDESKDLDVLNFDTSLGRV
jgi:hypothetical protein